jgi:glycosyltransferase involved in cell wall biosynthesis
MKLVAIILTLNEERHLRRCVESIEDVVDEVLVMDCYSTDDTLKIANELGARVLQKVWVNYATQFNYALTQLGEDVDWVLRIDADEYLTPALAAEIQQNMVNIPPDVHGVNLPRRMTFMGRLIRHGGVFPVQVLRCFRYGAGECENRWMDEHIKVAGKSVNFKNELIDDSLNSLSWWVNKHNNYASREVVDLLNLEYGFMPHDTVASLSDWSQASLKRWIKEHVYARLPGGFRAFAYFCYRYFLRLGFLDGKEGTAFHVLQGFWYRYLVDAKLAEVKRYIRVHECSVQQGIKDVLGIDVGAA